MRRRREHRRSRARLALHGRGAGSVSQFTSSADRRPATVWRDRVFAGANMPRVNYTAPSTVDEAVSVLAGAAGLAKVLSGGTDLLVQLKSGRMKPEMIVDMKKIPGMIGIREEADAFVIGAATPGVMLSAHKALEHAFPGIVEGVDLIGSTQIQGRASIAGNLCNASPAADSVPPVIAARATAVIAVPSGRRQIPLEQIVFAPGQTSLAKGELVGFGHDRAYGDQANTEYSLIATLSASVVKMSKATVGDTNTKPPGEPVASVSIGWVHGVTLSVS